MTLAPPERSSYIIRQYSKYIYSGVEWLGDVPSHWHILTFKRLGELQGGAGFPHEEQGIIDGPLPFYKVSDMNLEGNDVFLVNHNNSVTFDTAKRLGAYIFHKNTIVFPKVGAALLTNKRRILTRDSCCDNNTMGFVPKRGHYKWLYYWMLSLDFGRLANPGAVPSLNESQVRDLPVPVPSDREQQAIVSFLDRETARIDAMIEKKERLIALLEEKRTALVSHAITKGLDPNVSMRDSGIEWVGSIPKQWRVCPLKYVAFIQTGLTLGKVYDGRYLVTRPYLRVANVQDGYLDLDHITEVSLPAGEVKRFELEHGDVLMTEGGDFDKLGRGYIWEGQLEGCLHQNHVFAVRTNKRILLPKFLVAMMNSYNGKTYFTKTSQQTTNLACTNSTKLKNFCLPLPNTHEQARILETITIDTDAIDTTIKTNHRVIEYLKEFRTALISAVVTGKIDVRQEKG